MTFDDYQTRAGTTNLLKGDPIEPYYLALGLAGEAGEVANKIKKIIRDHQNDFDAVDKTYVTNELGDVLWYLAELCDVFDVKLGEVAKTNADKLASRKERGTLKGNGDNR